MAPPLTNITNTLPVRWPKAQGGKADPPAVAAGTATTAEPVLPSNEAERFDQEEDDLALLHSLKQLELSSEQLGQQCDRHEAVAEGEAATAPPAAAALSATADASRHQQEDLKQPQHLATEDAATSTAAATRNAVANTEGSQTGSPLALFAAAKARLARSNLEASCLISATLQRLHADPAAPPPPADSSSSGISSRVLVRLPQHRMLQPAAGAGSCITTSSSSNLASSGGPLPALAVLQKRNLVLKERLHSTMQLCTTLHEQNQDNMQKVTQLWADNQKLSHSLHSTLLDKQGLQQTIRQLTVEAALLAQQARRALLPAGQQQRAVAALPAPAAAGGTPVAAAAAAAAGAAGSPAAVTPEPGASLVGGWSQAALAASIASSNSRQGEAWQPGTSVHRFDCGIVGGMVAAVYVQGSSEGSGDKRRRLAPGMLAHCLRPVVAAAVAEAAIMDAGGSSGGFAGRLGTPGRTPKRKHRHASSGGGSSSAAAGAAAAAHRLSAADDPDQLPLQLLFHAGDPTADQDQQWRPAALGCGPLLALSSPATVGTLAAAGRAAARQEEEKGEGGELLFATFELFERKWHGVATMQLAPARRAIVGSNSGGSNGCCIM